MNHVDDLLRTFRDHLPPPTEAARRQALEGLREPRRPASPVGRRLGPLLAGVGVAGLIAVVGVLFVVTRTDDGTTTVAGARADWGLTAAVTVTPNPGVSTDEAVDRLRSAILERSRERDVAGLQIDRSSAQMLTMTIPGADEYNQARELVRSFDYAVYDLESSEVASGSLRDVRAAADRLPGRDRRFVIGHATLGPMSVFPTRARAERALRQRGWTAEGVVFGLPDGYVVIPGTDRLYLLRDRPILSSTHITRTAFGRDVLTLHVRPGDRALVSRLAPTGPPKRVRWALVVTTSGPTVLAESSSVRLVDGRLVLRQLRPSGLQEARIGGPVVPARVVVQSATPFGRPAPPLGDRPTQLPATLSGPQASWFSGHTGTRFDVDPSSIVQTISTRSGSTTFTGFSGLTTSGRIATWISTGTSADETQAIDCSPGPGIPIIRDCGISGRDNASVMVGRARSEITRIEFIDQFGRTMSGTVANEWFLVPLDPAPTGAENRSFIVTGELVAYDANGTVRVRTAWPFTDLRLR